MSAYQSVDDAFDLGFADGTAAIEATPGTDGLELAAANPYPAGELAHAYEAGADAAFARQLVTV